jgi:hypothetical protein
MSFWVVLLVLLVLMLLMGLINYWGYRKVEQSQAEWFKRVLPEGVDKEAFLRAAPYVYKALNAGKAYGIIDKRTQEEVWKTKTPEEAEAWIVEKTLLERQSSPNA